MFRTKNILMTALVAILLFYGVLQLCSNNPWPEEYNGTNTFFTNYASDFKTLDPAVSYYAHEGNVLLQIVECPLTYHYLKRPYSLMPVLLEEIPTAKYFDKNGKPINDPDPDADIVGRVEYTAKIKRGIRYQPHPCFAKNEDGSYKYRNLKRVDIPYGLISPNQFEDRPTRELKAEDFAIGLRRVCDPALASPVFSTFKSFIAGMDECSAGIRALSDKLNREAEAQGRKTGIYPMSIPYMDVPLTGIEVVDDYTYKIVLKRKYPQLIYWMSMQFFAPVPQEALDFYAEPLMVDRKITLKNWPIGTGAFMMDVYDPTRRIEMVRNPHFSHIVYPSEGEVGDSERGLLDDAGAKLPFVDRVVMAKERESVPLWVKFLQGYYDNAGIPEESFDNAVSFDAAGDMDLSPDMAARGITLHNELGPKIYSYAFNMLDSTVGGYSEEQCKLRQAISIALDYNEYIAIFLNGRGIMAQGVVPPGVYGYKGGLAGTNTFIDVWDPVREKHVRRPLEDAKKLMVEAGYPGGFCAKTGNQLVIYYDHAQAGDAAFKNQFIWMRDQMQRLGIDFRERATDLNRFRDKINTGNWMTSFSGWIGDYPDPENFFMLFDGKNAKASTQGPNSTNYDNPKFNKVFHKLESMMDGPARLALIEEADSILRHDAPFCWGFHPPKFLLIQDWFKNFKAMPITTGNFLYYRIDTQMRVDSQKAWNKPRTTPVMGAWIGIIVLILPFMIVAARRRRKEEEAMIGGND